jgi:NAD(P)H-hydrate epimerase
MAMLHIPDDLPRLSPRASDAHKGDFGTALLIGGSRGMAGAISLAGMAALRSGAGRVRLAVPDVCLETVAQFDPCYMTLPLDCDERGCIETSALQAIQDEAQQATCVAVGPGLSRSEGLCKLVGWLYRTLPQPLVIDADGLNALSRSTSTLSHAGGQRILTPHPGEFARFASALGWEDDKSPETQLPQAVKFAQQYQVIVVLKGSQTLITDGREQFRNSTGNPGMATGGTGDVLTGVITALVCQGLAPLAAARLGVFAHGLAGDLAADELGQVGLTARDLLSYLPAAWKQLR